jgi:hypothetical protein
LKTVGARVKALLFEFCLVVKHLPPEHDVAMPETVKVCQDGQKCATGTLPPVSPPTASVAGSGLAFTPPFKERGTEVITAQSFAPTIATGQLSVVAGGVRLLTISWPLVKDSAFTPNSPQNYFVDVRDANGVQTGTLNTPIMYAPSSPSAAGTPGRALRAIDSRLRSFRRCSRA